MICIIQDTYGVNVEMFRSGSLPPIDISREYSCKGVMSLILAAEQQTGNPESNRMHVQCFD
jgi:hypothetical protein